MLANGTTSSVRGKPVELSLWHVSSPSAVAGLSLNVFHFVYSSLKTRHVILKGLAVKRLDQFVLEEAAVVSLPVGKWCF